MARVAVAVKQATGRDLKIAGPVSFHLLPDIALSANGVSLSNAPGSANADMLTVEKLDVGLKLIPLLSHKIEIDHLTLNRPIIHLEINKQGQSNWTFQPQAAAAKEAAPTEGKSDVTQQLQNLSLGTVKIDDGTVSYADAAGRTQQQVTKLDASFSLPSIDDKMDLTASADWNGMTIAVDVTIKSPRDLLTGKGSALAAKIKSDLITLTLDVEAKSGAGYAGTLDLSSPSLRQFAAWTGKPLTAGPGLGALTLKSNIALKGKSVALSNLALTLDALKIGGDIAVDAGGQRPMIKGALDLGAVDLNPYLAAPTAGGNNAAVAPPGAPTTAGTGWSEAPIDASILKRVDATLTLSLTSLKMHTIDLGKTDLNLALAGGRATVALKDMALYGGNGSGRIALDGANPRHRNFDSPHPWQCGDAAIAGGDYGRQPFHRHGQFDPGADQRRAQPGPADEPAWRHGFA